MLIKINMEICKECKLEYDKNNVNINYPLQDNQCSECGTMLTETQVEELKQLINN